MYHFFYQYNPHDPLFGAGKLSWGYSVSGDLVNWAFLGTALDPTSSFDVDGCWSGSTTTLPDGRIAILYTGIDTDEVQVQNVAFAKNPSDLLLREWDKTSFNPIIPQPADVTGNNFRDPTTAWLGRDGLWRFAIAAEVDGVGSTVIYRSADFVSWERNALPLHASPGIPCWECPDFFPVAEQGTEGLDTSANGAGVRHVLKLSKAADVGYYVRAGGGRRAGRRPELAPDRPRPPVRGQVVLRRAQETARALGVGRRDGQPLRRRRQGLDRHSGDRRRHGIGMPAI